MISDSHGFCDRHLVLLKISPCKLWTNNNKGSKHRKLWNAKAEKINDIENHIKTTVLNHENNIFNPRLLYITARNSIYVQDVVNTCVKMEIYMHE